MPLLMLFSFMCDKSEGFNSFEISGNLFFLPNEMEHYFGRGHL